MAKELSILITSYQNPRLLDLCISSIKKNVHEIDYEIVVADSATGEELFDLMREKYPLITFIPNIHNVGFGKLVNQMINAACGKYFFIINADIIVKNNAMNVLLDYLKNNTDVGIASPKLINFDNSVQSSCFRFYSPLTIAYRRTFLGRFGFAKRHLDRFLMKKERQSDVPFEADWVMGSAMMTTRSAVEDVGTMDNSFFMYFEDVDWCWRFWEKGHRVVYNPQARVFHYHGKQSASKNVINSVLFNRYSRIHILSALKFFAKHYGRENPHQQTRKNTNKGLPKQFGANTKQ